jgi:hypothetical protein
MVIFLFKYINTKPWCWFHTYEFLVVLDDGWSVHLKRRTFQKLRTQ